MEAFARRVAVNNTIRYSCIAASVGVFGAWNYAQRGGVYQALSKLHQERYLPDPKWVYNHLNKYYTIKVNDSGNYPSWIGSMFSHANTLHFAFNTLTFASFSAMLSTLPSAHFASIILGGGLAATGSWIIEQRYKGNRDTAALGMSGIVSSVMGACTMLAPTMRITLFFVIPMPLWVATAAYVYFDTYATAQNFNSGIGHSAHAGGTVFGILYYTLFLRRYGGILGRSIRY